MVSNKPAGQSSTGSVWGYLRYVKCGVKKVWKEIGIKERISENYTYYSAPTMTLEGKDYRWKSSMLIECIDIKA